MEGIVHFCHKGLKRLKIVVMEVSINVHQSGSGTGCPLYEIRTLREALKRDLLGLYSPRFGAKLGALVGNQLFR